MSFGREYKLGVGADREVSAPFFLSIFTAEIRCISMVYKLK